MPRPGELRQTTPVAPKRPSQGQPPRTDLETRKEWMSFLQGNLLLHHADLLLRNGFDDLETLADMGDSDIKDLGIPAHDAVRLRKSLQRLRGPLPRAGEDSAVVSFLRDCGLRRYEELLLRNGFEDMESLLEIRDADMREMGISRGHSLKLAKRLREFQAGAAAPVQPLGPPPAQPPAAAEPSGIAAARKRYMQGPRTTEAQSSAVERSWARVQQMGSDVLGEKLYKHFFQLAPQTMQLYPPEVRHKYRTWSADEVGEEEALDLLASPALRKLFAKIINAVGVSAAGLRRPAQMVPLLTQLGARHRGYGANEEYWALLGDALLLTLRDCLEEEFTQEVELAWALHYGFISAVMIEGLRAHSTHSWEGRTSDKRSSSSVHSGHASFPRSVSEVPDVESLPSVRSDPLQEEHSDCEVIASRSQASNKGCHAEGCGHRQPGESA